MEQNHLSTTELMPQLKTKLATSYRYIFWSDQLKKTKTLMN